MAFNVWFPWSSINTYINSTKRSFCQTVCKCRVCKIARLVYHHRLHTFHCGKRATHILSRCLLKFVDYSNESEWAEPYTKRWYDGVYVCLRMYSVFWVYIAWRLMVFDQIYIRRVRRQVYGALCVACFAKGGLRTDTERTCTFLSAWL